MTARAQPWLMFPTRSTSPLRAYQTVPSTERSRVTRSPTASTVPVASPRSTTSPTPYWSSRIMNSPEMKSLTSVWAPKPSATPTIPAEAMSGAMSMPSSERIISEAIVKMIPVEVLLSTDAIVSSRCLRRSEPSADDSKMAPVRPPVMTPGSGPVAARLLIRSTVRCTSQRAMNASTMMKRTVSGRATNQSAKLASCSLSVRS